MRIPSTHSKGFTFTEVVIAIAIFMILAGVGVGAYFRYYNFALVDMDINGAITLVSRARFLAQKNATSSDYGIHLDPATHTLTQFQDAYTPGAPGNVSFTLGVLRITDLALSPVPGVTDQIVFERWTGKTVNAGTFTIGNDDYTYTFNVNPQGVVN
ncbi:prepilin-type N-terminal cleavage/methylation domain-containing protein [Candidatus Peregrinibacteria bacterium]|nr:prepilin-type N-terminal cleavage/methylation domain-containing protein [Candidatus Peregrinibacteria bacterium]